MSLEFPRILFQTRTEQLVQLLGVEAEASREVTLPGPGGTKLAFKTSRQGPVKTLMERFGEPDEIRKLSLRRPAGPEGKPEEPLTWKIWVWGPVQVMADETGTARYFAVTGQP